MSTILKIPKIAKKTKLGELLTNPTVISKNYQKYKYDEERKKYSLSRKDFTKKINNLSTGNKKYLVSGKLTNQIYSSDYDDKKNKRVSQYKRNFSITFTAKNNLTHDELYLVVGEKLREFYLKPRDGNSENYLTGFSMNSIQIPDNFEYHKRVKMFRPDYIQSKLLSKYSEPIDIKYNCVVSYLYNMFTKKYKDVNIEKIKKRLSEFCIIEEGVSIEAFEKYMEKYNKSIRYTILSPMFDCISQYKPNYRESLNLVFYTNNNHLYPLQDEKTQKYISDIITEKKQYNFYDHFHKTETTFYEKYKYIDKYNPEEEEEYIRYIMNKDMNINDFCIELIKETNSQPDYIDLNHKTGSIQSFKHPTKEIIYESYDDYHRRKTICEELNIKFNNKFIKFNNDSYGSIAQKLLKYLDDIPVSHYIEETFDYLNEYEPKPILDVLKNVSDKQVRENVYQIDYYKQYSSIFYIDFERYDIKIPIYDYFDTVEQYKGDIITYGEYFVKQMKYENVKVFGCFLNYKIVEILIEKKFIKKEDITHCITTKKYFEPSAFKEFVKITSELGEKNFKKLNNILNGTLKNMFIRKKTDYFTSDINSLCYIYNESIKNNMAVRWLYDENTGYHFIKTYTKHKQLSNTSSFYRSTLSCSILQTLKLIKKCSKKGQIVKVLTDAVYYKPYTTKLVKTPEITRPENDSKPLKPTQIIKNLGKYEHEFTDKELIKHRTKDITFKLKPIDKISKYIYGAGGTGKTYSLIKQLDERIENGEKISVFVTSYTNDAVLNLQNKIDKIMKPKNIECLQIDTLSRFLVRNGTRALHKFDLIVIDEILTVPTRIMQKIEQTNVPKIVLGDKYQMPAVINELYEQSYSMHDYLFKYYKCQEQKYTEGKSRYDKKTFEMLESFKKTGKTKYLKITNELKEDKIYKVNIAATNKKCIEINKKCCDHFHKKCGKITFTPKKEEYTDEDGETHEAKNNNGKKYIYKVGRGCPIRCETGNKKLFNNLSIRVGWRGRFENIKTVTKDDKDIQCAILYGAIYDDDKNCYTEDFFDIELSLFVEHFMPAYCMTANKWQGQTIYEKYAIHQAKREYFIKDDFGDWIKKDSKIIHRNMLYTACSRTGNYKNIYMPHHFKKISNQLPLWEPSDNKICANSKKLKYKIYKSSDDYIYSLDESNKKDYTFYEDVICTKKQIKQIMKILRDKKIVINQGPLKVYSFKPSIIQNKKRTVISVFKNRIKCIYYDENEKKKIKDMKPSKKRNMRQTLEKMQELFPKAEIKDNNNLILSFA